MKALPRERMKALLRDKATHVRALLAVLNEYARVGTGVCPDCQFGSNPQSRSYLLTVARRA
jgi:hypothetical protein